ncbi:NUDIX domain-containing protein [Cellulosimicrobium terreum]|nr:NUDIX domain-containing protein [Cellulosimicrobium terreum]
MQIRVAAYAVIVRDGLLLLPHWRKGDRDGWTLPGGGIDLGEHPEDAAVREVREETGYDVELVDVARRWAGLVPGTPAASPT